jgi:hypothetical protein
MIRLPCHMQVQSTHEIINDLESVEDSAGQTRMLALLQHDVVVGGSCATKK